MKGIIVEFTDGDRTKISYSDDGAVGFEVKNGGLIIINESHGWLRWISLACIKQFAQY